MSVEDEVLNIFETSGALLKGHFILRSGLHSGHFFQCARVCERLGDVSRLAELLLAKLAPLSFTTVLSPAMGGLVIGQEVARQASARFLFVEKDHNGDLQLRRNFRIQPRERILIVEDVITRGGRVQETIDIAMAHQANLQGVAVLVDRSNGQASFSVPMTALLPLTFPTYEPDALPKALADLPAIKPGS